jgi:hypothetical protein
MFLVFEDCPEYFHCLTFSEKIRKKNEDLEKYFITTQGHNIVTVKSQSCDSRSQHCDCEVTTL